MNVLSMRVSPSRRIIGALSITLAMGVCAGNAMAYSPGATYGEMRYAQYERSREHAAREQEAEAEPQRSGGNKAAYEQMMRNIEERRGGGHKQPVAKDAGAGDKEKE